MSLKIGDTVTIVIGQPLPEGEPVDELIYTSMGYMPMSLLELKNTVQDATNFKPKATQLNQNALQLIIEKSGNWAHVTEYFYKEDPENHIKRSAHVHTYDQLEMFPEQGNIN